MPAAKPAYVVKASTGVTKGPDGITTEWEFVTPEQAAHYSGHNLPNNRRLMDNVGTKYGRDMTTGHWYPTHEGLAFDVEGWLIDGQHRLDGIIKSGKSQWLLVTRGVSKKAVEVINRGKMRSLAHALQILGVTKASQRMVAIARVMMDGPNMPNRERTDQETKEFFERYADAISFAATTTSAPATVAAPIARAWLTVDPARLVRFCEAMADRIPADQAAPEDATARRLKAVYLAHPNRSDGDRMELYQKAQNALRAYLDGRIVQKLTTNDEDLFPLPTGD